MVRRQSLHLPTNKVVSTRHRFARAALLNLQRDTATKDPARESEELPGDARRALRAELG